MLSGIRFWLCVITDPTVLVQIMLNTVIFLAMPTTFEYAFHFQTFINHFKMSGKYYYTILYYTNYAIYYFVIQGTTPWKFTLICHLFLWNAVQILLKLEVKSFKLLPLLSVHTNSIQIIWNKGRDVRFNFIIQIRKLRYSWQSCSFPSCVTRSDHY